MTTGTLLPFGKASQLINQLLGLHTSKKQVWECCHISAEQLNPQAAVTPVASVREKLQKPDEQVYVMIDGSMLHIDGRWQEVKVARVFAKADDRQQELSYSCYCTNIGHYSGFTVKLDKLLAQVQGELVFVSDGAHWIRDYVSSSYPKARQILDLYHVLEKLAAAQEQCGAEANWLEQCRQHLSNSHYGKLMHAVERLNWKDREAFRKLRNYLLKNQYRMDYRSYKKQGLRIGSGPIESTHRSLLQQRMKLSGQRWKGKGAARMVKLRTAQANQQPLHQKPQLKAA